MYSGHFGVCLYRFLHYFSSIVQWYVSLEIHTPRIENVGTISWKRLCSAQGYTRDDDDDDDDDDVKQPSHHELPFCIVIYTVYEQCLTVIIIQNFMSFIRLTFQLRRPLGYLTVIGILWCS